MFWKKNRKPLYHKGVNHSEKIHINVYGPGLAVGLSETKNEIKACIRLKQKQKWNGTKRSTGRATRVEEKNKQCENPTVHHEKEDEMDG